MRKHRWLGCLCWVLGLLMAAMCMAPRMAWAADDPLVEEYKAGRFTADSFEYQQGGLTWLCKEYLAAGSTSEAVVYGVSVAYSLSDLDSFTIPQTVRYAAAGRTLNVVGIISYDEANDSEATVSKYDAPFRVTGSASEDDIRAISVPSTVRFIGVSAFRGGDYGWNGTGFENLATVNFDGSSQLCHIEDYAFYRCQSLNQLSGQGSLGQNQVPTGVSYIGKSAFESCAFTKISFPVGATVGDYVLAGCYGLKRIENAPSDVGLRYGYLAAVTEEYPDFAIEYVSFSPGLTQVDGLGTSDGSHYPNLTTVVLPEGLEVIGWMAFEECAALESINLPDSLTEIGGYAFKNCVSLTGIAQLPSSVSKVDAQAFYGCKSLHMSVVHPGTTLNGQYGNSGITSLTLSGDVNWFDAYEFVGCHDLESITVLPGGSGPFHSIDGVLYDTSTYGGDYLIRYPPAKKGKDFWVPTTCDGMGGAVFEGCSLSSIHIPVNVRWLDDEQYDTNAYGFGEGGWYYPFTKMASNPVVYYVKNSYVAFDLEEGIADYYNIAAEAGPAVRITYKLNGGFNATTNPQTVVGGSSVTLGNPMRNGYNFLGWYHYDDYEDDYVKLAGGVLTPSDGELVDGVTVEARWKKKGISLAGASVTLKSQKFTGKELKPSATVTCNGKTLTAGKDYTLSYKNNVNVGTAQVTVTGTGAYEGSASATFKIVKAANPMKVKVSKKSVKSAKVQQKACKVAPLKVSKAKGKVKYARVAKGTSACLTVNKKNGKVTVAKGTAKGTYTIRIKITAAGNANYKAKAKTVTCKVVVK